jgi:DNA-binding CsgD family transcriptional regulator/PAS domain-containing protein
MAKGDDLLKTIEAVHAAGLDEECWPQALLAIARHFNALGATLEDFDKRPFGLRYLRLAGLPSHAEIAYLDHYQHHNPRAAYAFRNLSQKVLVDYHLIDEQGMDRDAYYSKYLRSLDLRYFMSGQILNTHSQQAIVSIQRTRRQGHVGPADIGRMQTLLPHLRQAYDMATRLRSARANARTFEQALGWLSDGVALLRRDGRIVYANDAFQAIARRNDGLRVVRGSIEFATGQTRSRFAAALGAIGALEDGNPLAAVADFFAPRSGDAPAYVVSLRPLAAARQEVRDAVAIVFIRDPLGATSGALRLLRDLLGLTEAEASLALTLQAGGSLGDHAHERNISLNTVYTHLRRIKEKTGCSRLPQLIQKLNGLKLPARDG